MNKQKILNAFLITWVTHNSRKSERMKKLGIKLEKSVYVSSEQEIQIAKYILEIIKEDNIKCLAFNICKDHIHIIIACEREERDNIVRKLKGKSSQRFKLYMGINNDIKYSLWAQKYHYKSINSEESLNSSLEYVYYNKLKHCSVTANKGLQPLVRVNNAELNDIIKNMITPIEEVWK